MKKFIILFSISTILLFTQCTSTDILNGINGILGGGSGEGSVTEQEVGLGLKEALSKGITIGADLTSKTDGFLGNPLIKIPWPAEVQKVKNTLNTMGMSSLVGKVETSLNRAAEDAAQKAKPIFINAIKQMTIQDAMSILRGEPNSATNFLRRTTSTQLTNAFSPVISNSLDKVNATKFWGDAAGAYNKLPLVKPVETDLTGYVTGKALDGLFTMVEQQEAKIRKDPLARTTDLLKRVFGLLDK